MVQLSVVVYTADTGRAGVVGRDGAGGGWG